MPPFDLVFMRNVMIYFDIETKREVLGRMRGQLAPHGLPVARRLGDHLQHQR